MLFTSHMKGHTPCILKGRSANLSLRNYLLLIKYDESQVNLYNKKEIINIKGKSSKVGLSQCNNS